MTSLTYLRYQFTGDMIYSISIMVCAVIPDGVRERGFNFPTSTIMSAEQ